MTSEGLGEMFEGDSADTGAGKFPLVSMGDRAEGLACADPGARTPIGASGNFVYSTFSNPFCKSRHAIIITEGFTHVY
jgi:hypothetical protein